MNHIIRLPEVISRTGLSRSSIYSFVKKETFPQPVKLGVRAIGWKTEEVSTWIDNCKKQHGAS